jgi:hypothetical protein
VVPTTIDRDKPDRSWVRELAGIGRSQRRAPVADRVDEVLAETGFGCRPIASRVGMIRLNAV